MTRVEWSTIGARTDSRAYRLYGLRIRSEWSLPAVVEAEAGEFDIELLEGRPEWFNDASREAGIGGQDPAWYRYARLGDGSTYVRYRGLFEFLVSPDGSRIVGLPHAAADSESFHTHLLGQVLSLALLQRGIEPTHSTVMIVDGEAVGFLGDSGYGKSSLAATFLKAGNPLLTDDLLVISEEEERWIAHPGPPRIKLYPETARSILGDSVSGTRVHPQSPKLLVPLKPPLAHEFATPLKALYVLPQPGTVPDDEDVTIAAGAPQRACLELIKNTYNAVVASPERLQSQLAFAGRLTTSIPVKFLSYRRDLRLLPAIREAILSDLAG
ncbi:hypothetical protein BH23GEM5_BH23GEM5_15640 [soil metagenome]